MEEETLSLSTFQPAYAHEPYLNTPRSLEACRIHGIQPIELIEIPFEEFRQAYPDEDGEATLRRFERIETTRRRILSSVKAEWERLCESGWKEFKELPKNTGETIIEVNDPNSYCTVLELQAARFRKIEQQQWKVMQKMLFKEIKKAAEQQRHKEIIEKQELIFQKHEKGQSDREHQRAILRKEELEVRKQNEEKKMKEIRLSQARAAEELSVKQIEDEEKKQAIKQERLQKEAERLRRQEFTREIKNSILNKMEARLEERMNQYEVREKESQERLESLRKKKEMQLAQKRGDVEEKLERARLEMDKISTNRKQQLVLRREDLDSKMQTKRDQESAARRSRYEERIRMAKEKLEKVKETNEIKQQEKIMKTMTEAEQKEMAARQELEKVEEERQRRLQLKKIRQETFEIAFARQQQAHEHRIAKIDERLQQKRQRGDAIKNGSATLAHMRYAMTESLGQAKSILREEIERLDHIDQLTPDNVVQKVLSVSQSVLFPGLERSMGGSASQTLRSVSCADSSMNQKSTRSSTHTGHRSSRLHDDRAMTAPTAASASHHKNERTDRSNSPTRKTPILKVTVTPSPLSLQEINPINLTNTLVKLSLTASTPQSTTLPPRSPHRNTLQESQSSFFTMPDNNNSNDGNNTTGNLDEKSNRRNKNTSNRHSKTVLDPDPETITSNTITGASGGIIHDRSDSDNNNPNTLLSRDDTSRQPSKQRSNNNNNNINTNHSLNTTGGSGSTPGRVEKFRREFSSDHPLAGGRGRYDRERDNGIPMERLSTLVRDRGRATKPDPYAQLDALRKEQNDALLRLLEEERLAETERERMGRLLGSSEVDERRQLELVFAEERRRASERIVSLTRLHEQRLREAVLSMASKDN